MIKDDMTPFQFRVKFFDSGIERTHYADDRRYYEQLVAHHGHLSGLRIESLELTADQQRRLDSLPADIENVALYVQYGTDEPDTAHYDAAAYQRAQEASARPAIELQRKRQEARGVTINGIRYSGGQGNRQALSEALQAADAMGISEFETWLSSDKSVHRNVPVADVYAALLTIGKRRSALITLEANYVAAGEAGSWETPYDE